MSSPHNWPFIINLGNSIIGVAVLAMPFCFQKCGIVLSMVVLLFCTWLTLISCQLLMKAGITSRRRSYEFLAYYTHGAPGKFVSEVGMIGFQVGTLIAQIVVIGDLGPSIVTKVFGIQNIPGLRVTLMILLCMSIGLPMALVKDIRAVSRVSAVCVTFYSTFVLYVLWLALPNLWSAEWFQKVHFWRPQGLFQTLPILSFSFGCQTQLFLLYDALPEPSLKTMSKVVSCAVNLCAVAYLMVGFCGYIAFYMHDIPGDVIGIFPNTFFTDLMKVCFVFSIVITFPVMVFPCRASIYTLLFAKPNQDELFHHFDEEKKSKARDEAMDHETYIPAKQFKVITVTLVVGSMVIGILIPNVEFILGMNGAVMGTLICYIFPALFYLKVMGSKPDGKNLAQLVLVFGITILLVSTYATLKSQDSAHTRIDDLSIRAPNPVDEKPDEAVIPQPIDLADKKPPAVESKKVDVKIAVDKEPIKNVDNVVDDIRKEPPNPDPPDNQAKPPDNAKIAEKGAVIDDGAKIAQENSDHDKLAAANRVKELELQQKEKKQEELIAQLEKQRIEQKILIEEQKQLLKEFKDHHDKDMKQQVLGQSQLGQEVHDNQKKIDKEHQQQSVQSLQFSEPYVDASIGQIPGQNLTLDQLKSQKFDNSAQQQQQPQPLLPQPRNLPEQNQLQPKNVSYQLEPKNLLYQPELQNLQQPQPENLQQPQLQKLQQPAQPPNLFQQQPQNQNQPQQRAILGDQQQQQLPQGAVVSQQMQGAELSHHQEQKSQADQEKVDNVEPQRQIQTRLNAGDVNRKKRDAETEIESLNSTETLTSTDNKSMISEKHKPVPAFINETSFDVNALSPELKLHTDVAQQKPEEQNKMSPATNDSQKARTNEEMRRKLKSVDSPNKGLNPSSKSVFESSSFIQTSIVRKSSLHSENDSD